MLGPSVTSFLFKTSPSQNFLMGFLPLRSLFSFTKTIEKTETEKTEKDAGCQQYKLRLPVVHRTKDRNLKPTSASEMRTLSLVYFLSLIHSLTHTDTLAK